MSKINKIRVENVTYDVQDNTSGYITKDVNNLTNYELKTNTGATIELTINSSTYEMTLNLKNSAGTTISTGNVDLPLETMVVGATYDNNNKKIILELKNGTTLDVPVGDLINGLQSEITNSNKLDASLVDDSLSNNKFVTNAEKTTWNEKANVSDIPTKTSDLINDNNFTSQEVYFNEMITLADISSIFVFENKKRGIYYFDSNSDVNQFRYKIFDSDSRYSSVNTCPFYLEIYKDFDFDNFEENEYFALLLGEDTYGNINKYKFRKSNNNVVISGAVGVSSGTFLLTKAQTIIGVKTFNSIPQQSSTTAPTLDTQFTNKKYVDDLVASISGDSIELSMYNQAMSKNFDFSNKYGIYYPTAQQDTFQYFSYINSIGGTSKGTFNGSVIFLNVFQKVEEAKEQAIGYSKAFAWALVSEGGRLYVINFVVSNAGFIETAGGLYKPTNTYFLTNASQTISGVKTFNDLPQSSATPTNNNDLVNKSYVDNAITSAITTTLNGSY